MALRVWKPRRTAREESRAPPHPAPVSCPFGAAVPVYRRAPSTALALKYTLAGGPCCMCCCGPTVQDAKHCTQALFFAGVLFTFLTDILIKKLKVRAAGGTRRHAAQHTTGCTDPVPHRPMYAGCPPPAAHGTIIGSVCATQYALGCGLEIGPLPCTHPSPPPPPPPFLSPHMRTQKLDGRACGGGGNVALHCRVG